MSSDQPAEHGRAHAGGQTGGHVDRGGLALAYAAASIGAGFIAIWVATSLARRTRALT